MELRHVIYNSASTTHLSESELVELLEKSRNANAARGVTGMLLYNDGCFFQVLEGPSNAIDSLVAKISVDPRHDRMTVIIDEPIHRRSFGEWTMGFAHVASSELGEIAGLNDFFDGRRVLTEVDAGRAKKLLAAFGQGRWRIRLANHRPGFTPIAASEKAPQRPPYLIAYQPIVDAKERSVFAHEAHLIGENDESSAEVLQRLALAEIDEFDADVRRQAVGLAARLGLRSSLYLGFVPRLGGTGAGHLASTLATAEQSGIDPARLLIEMHHEVTATDPLAIAESLRDARAQGMRFSIGDFGTGHAGYALLEHYQPDTIALGAWLTHEVAQSGPRQAIIRGLVQTCGDLGIDVIAKGIHTLDQYEWLRSEGIDLFQGSLFAAAAPATLPTPSIPS